MTVAIDRLETIEHSGFADLYNAAPQVLAEKHGIVHATIAGANCVSVLGRQTEGGKKSPPP